MDIDKYHLMLHLLLLLQKKELYSFEKMLEFIKQEFEKQLTKEEIIKTMSANVKLGNSPFIKIIPLYLKIFFVKLAYIEIRKHLTITYSNIGRIGILGEYQKYIDYFLVLVSPDSVEKIKCSSCTFGNKIAFTFTSILISSLIPFFSTIQNTGFTSTIRALCRRTIFDAMGLLWNSGVETL